MNVALAAVDGELRVAVTGGAGDQLSLGHIRDRVEATGGSVTVNHPQGLARVKAWFPGPLHTVAAVHA